jgi:serine/threonine-protein kinase
MQLAAGATFGPYRISGVLGHGGMASVYRAHDPGLNRFVALKVLLPQFLSDPTFADRFLREAKSTAALEHPNIVPLYASGIENGVPWMAMRLVTGGTLSAFMKKGPVEPPRAVSILSGVAAALDYAHASGFVHRDVTSNNILLDDGGHPYLGDFGIARMLGGTATITSGIIGTPQYMAPEQARGETVDHRADIYALGIVAYEVFTRRVPFTADTPAAILVKHILEAVPTPSPSEVAAPAFEAIRRCLAKKPGDRWPSASAFVGALAHGLRATASTEQVASLHTAGHLTATLSSAKPWRWAAYLGGAGAMVGVVVAGLTLLTDRHPTKEPGAGASGSARVGAPSPTAAAGAVGALFAPAVTPGGSPGPGGGVPAGPTPSPFAAIGAVAASPRPPSATPTTAPLDARLTVLGNPASVLSVDGFGGRRLPAELSLPPGRHQLVVRRIGCRSVGQSVELLAGEAREVTLEPECAPEASTPLTPAVATNPALLPSVTPSFERMSPGVRKLAYLVGDWVIEGRFLRDAGAASGKGSCKWIGLSEVMCRTEWSQRAPDWMVAAYDGTTGGYWFSSNGGPRNKFQVQGPTWVFEVEGKLEGRKTRQRTTLVETGPSTADIRIDISWDRKAWHHFFEGVQRRR